MAEARALKDAENRLQDTLARLDGSVASALVAQSGRHSSDDFEQTIATYQRQMTDLHSENKHLREEVQNLQRQIGADQHAVTHYKQLCEEATKRIDELLVELEQL